MNIVWLEATQLKKVLPVCCSTIVSNRACFNPHLSLLVRVKSIWIHQLVCALLWIFSAPYLLPSLSVISLHWLSFDHGGE